MKITKLVSILFPIAFIYIASSCFAQPGKGNGKRIPSTNWLRDKFPDETFYVTESIEKYTYDYNSKEDLVSARQNFQERVLCLKELDNVFAKKVWYNNQSDVAQVRNYNSKGRRYPTDVFDGKYKTAGIY